MQVMQPSIPRLVGHLGQISMALCSLMLQKMDLRKLPTTPPVTDLREEVPTETPLQSTSIFRLLVNACPSS